MGDQPNLVSDLYRVPNTEYELVVNATTEGQVISVTLDQFTEGDPDPIREGVIPRPSALEGWDADSLRSLVGVLMDVLGRDLLPRLPDGWVWQVDPDMPPLEEVEVAYRPWSGIWPNNWLWVSLSDGSWGHGDGGPPDGYVKVEPGASKQEVIVQLVMAAEAWAIRMEEAVRNGGETCRDGRESSDAE
jgi:hypothetical protein